MNIKINFTINTVNYIVPWEIQHSLDRLRIKLKKYIKKKQNGIIIYEMDENDALYQQVLELKKIYKDDLEIVSHFKVEYSKEELNRAVAFIPKFDKIQLEEYGDDNLTHVEICNKCGNTKMSEKLIASPSGKSKKLSNEELLVKCGEQIDEVYGISKKMYENITNDFLKKGFRPIYSKRSEQPFAYGLYGEKEIHLYNDNYTYELCNYCGTINAEEKQSTDKFCDFYVLENISFEDSPVVASREYYYGNQVMLVSPELYSYITERIKNAKFIPVFLKKEE